MFVQIFPFLQFLIRSTVASLFYHVMMLLGRILVVDVAGNTEKETSEEELGEQEGSVGNNSIVMSESN